MKMWEEDSLRFNSQKKMQPSPLIYVHDLTNYAQKKRKKGLIRWITHYYCSIAYGHVSLWMLLQISLLI